MKRIIRNVTAILLALALGILPGFAAEDASDSAAGDSAASVPETELDPYDVNGDGAVNTKDLTRLMKYIAGDGVEVFVSDLNGDTYMDAKDLTRLMKYISGVNVEFDIPFRALASTLKKEGLDLGEGIYSFLFNVHMPEDMSKMDILAYDSINDSVVIGFGMVGGLEGSERFGDVDYTVLVIPYNMGSDGKALYMREIIDAQFGRELYVEGEIDIAAFGEDTTLDYTEADFGAYDEAEIMSLISKTLYESLVQADYHLGTYNSSLPPVIRISDLGFTKLE